MNLEGLRRLALTGGDWVIYLLLLCSVVALAVIVDRVIVLRREESAPAVTEYLNLPALRSAWQALQAHVTPQTAQQATTLLLRGVMAGLFLRQL